MPGYVVLYKYTQQGLANIKGMPDMAKRRKEAAERLGIRVIGVWHLMGEYDAVSVVEAPDDQTLAVALLAGGAQGYLTTQTMRALSEDEFAQVVGKLP